MQNVLGDETSFYSKHFDGLAGQGLECNGLEFESCYFTDCDITAGIFKACKFIECVFIRCNLSLVKVPQSVFSDVKFEECKLVGVDWTRAGWSRVVFATPFNFFKCIINDSSFFGLVLDEVTLDSCKAHDVDFREASLRQAVFTDTDLAHSLFGKTNLSEANFSGAVNYDIDVFENVITGAIFSRYEAVRLLMGMGVELVD